MKLRRHDATPLHRQLSTVLAGHIRGGRFRPGERIPSEREICKAYGVSRTTVRQTMSDLVASGLLVVELLSLGNGVPLALYRIHLPPETGDPTARALLAAEAEGRVTSGLVLEHVRRVAGLEPAQVVQTYEAAPASAELAGLLGVAEGQALVASSRTVLTATGAPITHDHAYYRGDRYRFTIRRAYTL